ncbi:uncharacterized protein TNCT_390761 [Trichonephila clavata]|uniref:Uncharacterized protein n=1 Tax=Trichonephila clavata TaxID=2740835 RepID=A0A8X6GJA2_TRICU|nr:uncharacterized protein TNCT_390761 [Trichonephila clavata]
MSVRCLVCSKKHFPILCPNLCREKKNFFSSPSKIEINSVTSNSSSGSTDVLLQTLRIRASDPSKTKIVRCLCDSASQRSYINRDLAEFLDLKIDHPEFLKHSLFGAKFVTFGHWIFWVYGPLENKTRNDIDDDTVSFFEKTVKFNQGRYEVNLPWVEGHPKLLDLQFQSEKRLNTMTSKLISTGKFDSYDKILKEWEQLGIIEPVPINIKGNKRDPFQLVEGRLVLRSITDERCSHRIQGMQRTNSLQSCWWEGPIWLKNRSSWPDTKTLISRMLLNLLPKRENYSYDESVSE